MQLCNRRVRRGPLLNEIDLFAVESTSVPLADPLGRYVSTFHKRLTTHSCERAACIPHNTLHTCEHSDWATVWPT